VIVNQMLARTFYPGQSAIGRRIMPGGDKEWRTIVGVVADIKNAGLDKPAGTELFMPFAQTVPQGFGLRGPAILVKSSGDPRMHINAVRQQIARIDPSLGISSVRTMDEVFATVQSRPRFLMLLLSIFSGVALVLAAVGIYGVISYAVGQRTTEFGIRMALGAAPSSVSGMVIRQGLMLGAAGIVGGVLGAAWLTRFLRGMLFGVGTFDLTTFTVMAGVLLGVTVLACYIPARRATRVDPMVALRYE
jgi:putative ABC transport system permease protein